MVRSSLVTAALVFAAACTGQVSAPSANEAETDTQATSRAKLVGKWRLIEEEPADDGGGIFGQERRLLRLGDDGSFDVKNYVEARAGEWTLAGDELILGELHARVEAVDDARLVLVENLPEIYLRGGPPRKVRNTYRRVSESELGPMLGAKVVTSAPTPGEYLGAYAYGLSKYPTMEIHISKGVSGRARLTLAADGTMTGCFGVVAGGTSSRSEYASDNGRAHAHQNERDWLLGVQGQWAAEDERARVTVSRSWPGSCAPEGVDEGLNLGPLELECVAIATNERLPVDSLACRIVTADSTLNEIAINPADTERAGPYTMQLEPMPHIEPDIGRPWLLLGRTPGLWVESRDDRDDIQPVVTFRADTVDFVEADFLEPPDPPADATLTP